MLASLRDEVTITSGMLALDTTCAGACRALIVDRLIADGDVEALSPA